MSNFKTSINLKSESFDIARKIVEIDKEYEFSLKELEKFFKKSLKSLAQNTNLIREPLWDELIAKEGLEPNKEWRIDSQYWSEHKILFLLELEDENTGDGLKAFLNAIENK